MVLGLKVHLCIPMLFKAKENFQKIKGFIDF